MIQRPSEREVVANVVDEDRSDKDITNSREFFINNLLYQMPSSSSLANRKTSKVQYCQKRDYDSGDTIVCDWNTGSSLVLPDSSYLSMDVLTQWSSVAGAHSATLGKATAVSLFQRIKIMSKSGTELEDNDRCAQWSTIESNYTKDNEWWASIGAIAGHGQDYGNSAGSQPTALRVNIPLSLLAGLFNPLDSNKPIPAQLASGLHFEIATSDHRQAFKVDVNPSELTGYKLQNIRFVLDCVDLVDGADLKLQEESALNGLDYVYPRYFSAINTWASGTTDMNLQVRKAVSQALRVVTASYNQSTQNSASDDSNDTNSFDYTQWQYRVGNQYFPNARVGQNNTTTAQTSVDSYMEAMKTYGKLSMSELVSKISPTDFRNSLGVLAEPLETNGTLSMSGIGINNSKALELEAKLGTALPAVVQTITFLKYVCVARVFPDNVHVKF